VTACWRTVESPTRIPGVVQQVEFVVGCYSEVENEVDRMIPHSGIGVKSGPGPVPPGLSPGEGTRQDSGATRCPTQSREPFLGNDPSRARARPGSRTSVYGLAPHRDCALRPHQVRGGHGDGLCAGGLPTAHLVAAARPCRARRIAALCLRPRRVMLMAWASVWSANDPASGQGGPSPVGPRRTPALWQHSDRLG